MLMTTSCFSSAGGAVFCKYPAVHLHRSEVGRNHRLALAGEEHLTHTSCCLTTHTLFLPFYIMDLFYSINKKQQQKKHSSQNI